MTEAKEPYLHWLPEEDADTEIELGLIRMMNENREIALSVPFLPRVQPSGVVDGEWYWISIDGSVDTYGRACETPFGEVGFWVDDVQFAAGNMDAIWGPVPKFTLEGEK